MKTKPTFLGVSILFFLLAAVLSLVFWNEVSFAAKIAFFACGFVSGISLGRWLSRHSKPSGR